MVDATTGNEAVQDVNPADFNLPTTHIVQALEGRYIKTAVLKEVLEKKWPGNAAFFVRWERYLTFLCAESG